MQSFGFIEQSVVLNGLAASYWFDVAIVMVSVDR